MHQDRNKVYLYKKVIPKRNDYSYRRGINEFFITYRGKDIERCKTMQEVNERLDILRGADESSLSDLGRE